MDAISALHSFGRTTHQSIKWHICDDIVATADEGLVCDILCDGNSFHTLMIPVDLLLIE
jgi:hypothetical protein